LDKHSGVGERLEDCEVIKMHNDKEIKKISIFENLFYWISNILCLGLWWLLKIIIKKAIIESVGEER
jgi:hypothetical protein